MKKQKKVKKITAKYLENSGLYYLQRFPASTNHFKKIMRRKIMRSAKEHPETDLAQCDIWLDETAAKFQKYGYINDQLLAKSLVKSLSSKGYSSILISKRMNDKGIPRNLIEQSILNAHENLTYDPDLMTALKLCKKKKIGPFLLPHKEKAPTKELAALARAGHRYDIAKRALDLSEEEAEDILDALQAIFR